MAFIRRKRVKGRVYFQLVENIRENGKTKQRVIKHLGNDDSARDYCRKHKIPFEVAQYETRPIAYFSSLNQISEFTTALKGRSEIPLKFEYLHDGANRWSRLVRSADYKLGIIETKLIQKSVQDILKEAKARINLVDLGCGTGEKALIFLDKIKKHRKKYVALDISEQMLDLANLNILKKFPHLNSEFHKIDFEEGNFAHITESLREKNHPYNLLMFLGNTLGNVSDMSRVLTNIRESMTLDDYLLIGIELFDLERIREIVGHYKGNKLLMDNTFTSLGFFGLEQSDGKFEVKFNRDKSQVEVRFVVNNDKEIACGSKKIALKNGKKILLMISYKTTPKNIQILLAETGFVIKRLFLNENEDYALVLCKATTL